MNFLKDDSSEEFKDNKENQLAYGPRENEEEEINQAFHNTFIWGQRRDESMELDEDLQRIASQVNPLINQQKSPSGQSLFIINNDDKKTKPTTITSPAKIKGKMIKEIPELIQNNEKRKIQHKIFLGKKKGRKNKTNEKGLKSKHNKDSEDNKMRKIKVHFMDYTVNMLNESLEDKRQQFYKIDSNISVNLKKEFNEALMERSLYDIFRNENLSNKYRKIKDEKLNLILIDKIYEEKVEKKTIEILEKKYIDIINDIKKNCLDEFLAKIEEKENRNKNENDGEYFNSLKKLFNNYENWFKDKKGRASKHSKEKKKRKKDK